MELNFENGRCADRLRGRGHAVSPAQIRARQEELQLLADSPQLRHRRGYGPVTSEAPFADSRRPTDPKVGVMDYRTPAMDAHRNYAAGIL